MASQTTPFVEVVNLDELNRAINLSGKLYAAAMHKGLLQAAEPVKQDADSLAGENFSGMKREKTQPTWQIQRKGQTIHEVYVAPTRGRGGNKKIKFGDPGYSAARSEKFRNMMMGKSYEPALERNRARVVATVEQWIGVVTREL